MRTQHGDTVSLHELKGQGGGRGGLISELVGELIVQFIRLVFDLELWVERA